MFLQRDISTESLMYLLTIANLFEHIVGKRKHLYAIVGNNNLCMEAFDIITCTQYLLQSLANTIILHYNV